MKKLSLIGIVVGMLSAIGAFAHEVSHAEKAAIARFISAQTTGTDQAVEAAVSAQKQLFKQGYVKPGDTAAVLLGGGCGFAGCDATYFVTSEYRTLGANTQTAVVAGTVSVSFQGKAEVIKVLSDSEISSLTH